jgi:hypothetical protein
MAKFELKFYSIDSKLWWIKSEVSEEKDCILITCSDENENEITLGLDKSTAIKFAKTLRTEINKITESEVTNG